MSQAINDGSWTEKRKPTEIDSNRRRAAAYQRAMAKLRKRHQWEFEELYEEERSR